MSEHAINECGKCGKLATTDKDRIGRLFKGMCRRCYKPKKGELPSCEFVPPSAMGSSILFKEQYRPTFEDLVEAVINQAPPLRRVRR